MNFDTKYLIRWGLPGWYALLWLAYLLVRVNKEKVFKIINEEGSLNFAFIAAVVAIITLAGIVLGYVFHQIFFYWFWILMNKVTNSRLRLITSHIEGYYMPLNYKTNRINEYYYIEYLWQKELSKLPESIQAYISERYRHLLSSTQNLGALTSSAMITFAMCIVTLIKTSFSIEYLSITAVAFSIFIVFQSNYKYYSENAAHFQGRMLNDLSKKEFDEVSDKGQENGRTTAEH